MTRRLFIEYWQKSSIFLALLIRSSPHHHAQKHKDELKTLNLKTSNVSLNSPLRKIIKINKGVYIISSVDWQ